MDFFVNLAVEFTFTLKFEIFLSILAVIRFFVLKLKKVEGKKELGGP